MAALLVVLYHIPKWGGLLDVAFVRNGYLMVDLFFVLSGFVIFTAYRGKINSPADLARFQWLRFGRLYPVHLVFLAAWVGLELLKLASARSGVTDLSSVPFGEPNTIAALVKQVFLLQGVLPNEPISFNWPAWSISTEFYTYLVFGLAMLILRKRAPVFFGGVALLAVSMLASNTTLGFDYLLRCLAGFSIGCLVAQLIARAQIVLPSYLSVVVFAATVVFVQFAPEDAWRFAIYLLSGLLIVMLCMSSGGALSKALKYPALLWLGAISYSLYMAHSFVMACFSIALKRIARPVEIVLPTGKKMMALGIVEAAFATAALLALILIVSHWAHRLIERPFRQRSRELAFSESRPRAFGTNPPVSSGPIQRSGTRL